MVNAVVVACAVVVRVVVELSVRVKVVKAIVAVDTVCRIVVVVL